jgi:phage terminase large subunit
LITEKDLSKHERVLLSWRRDPVLFVKQALQATPEKWQEEALKNIRDHDRLAIRSGHGVGKSAFLAWVIIWWLITRYPAKVACTANTSTQLSDVLWGELDKWVRRLPEGVRGLLELKSEYLTFTADPKQSFAVARTARKEQPEAFQGYHSANMLFVVDEASGVDDIIFEVGRGAMSSKGAKTILTGNPTRTNGYFYNAFHSMRAYWKQMHVPCNSSSQVTQKYIDECKDEYGEESNAFRVRVLGEFPIEGDNVVIPLHLVESAVTRDVTVIPDSAEVWGLDVARFGDDENTLAKRRSNHLMEPIKAWSGVDLMQTAGRVKREYDDAKTKPELIFVDSIGIGAGVADRLAEQGLPVVSINVSESPAVGEKFNKLRDELWWCARDWFRSLEVKIPNDGKLIAELTLPTYGFTSSGKTKIESKDEIKKRTAKTASSVGKSPDRADALCLTFATGVMVTRKERPIVYPNMGYV